jgi:hypothetical protein
MFLFQHMTEALESWRVETLKDTKSASIQNSSNLGLSNEEARMWTLLQKKLLTSTCAISFLMIWHLLGMSKVFLLFCLSIVILGFNLLYRNVKANPGVQLACSAGGSWSLDTSRSSTHRTWWQTWEWTRRLLLLHCLIWFCFIKLNTYVVLRLTLVARIIVTD